MGAFSTVCMFKAGMSPNTVIEENLALLALYGDFAKEARSFPLSDYPLVSEICNTLTSGDKLG